MKTFSKEERLCSRKLLDLLFKNGSSFLLYPYRISYLFVPETARYPVQVVINVSKRRYKHAVDRNLIKRRIREAYRSKKQEELYFHVNRPNEVLLLSIQFVGKKKYPYDFLDQKMSYLLKKLVTTLATHEVS